MTDRDETERLKAEVARLQKKSELHKQAADRWFPCPDHRDKRELVDGCTVCQIERLEAALKTIANLQVTGAEIARDTEWSRKLKQANRIAREALKEQP